MLGERLKLADEDAQVMQLIVQQLAPDLMELFLSHTLHNAEKVILMIWILLSQVVNPVNATHTFFFWDVQASRHLQDMTRDTTRCHQAENGSGCRSTLLATDANAMTEDRGRGSAGLGVCAGVGLCFLGLGCLEKLRAIVKLFFIETNSMKFTHCEDEEVPSSSIYRLLGVS